MYRKWTILEVQDKEDKWCVLYIIEHVPETPEDGPVWAEQGVHWFPKDIFEWRAAEYDIDPTDMDTLVDIVLAEPFLNRDDYNDGEMLRDAPDIESARAFHKSRCARGKLRARLNTRGSVSKKGGVLYKLRTESWFDSEALSLKKDYVHQQRQMVKHQKKTLTSRDRINQLKARMFPEGSING